MSDDVIDLPTATYASAWGEIRKLFPHPHDVWSLAFEGWKTRDGVKIEWRLYVLEHGSTAPVTLEHLDLTLLMEELRRRLSAAGRRSP